MTVSIMLKDYFIKNGNGHEPLLDAKTPKFACPSHNFCLLRLKDIQESKEFPLLGSLQYHLFR